MGHLPFTGLCLDLHEHEQRRLSFIDNTTDFSGPGKRFKMRKTIDLKLHNSLIGKLRDGSPEFGSVEL